MKMKTRELGIFALDWAVAKCECGDDIVEIDDPHFYSTDWTLAGPMIERERISIGTYDDGIWCADITAGDTGYIRAFGSTPLIAAMRCYVASRLGDEVEIPDELRG